MLLPPLSLSIRPSSRICILHRRLWEHALGWLKEKRARQPLNGIILTLDLQPLETGMQMMRVADSRWPESLQQQQASTQWNEALKTRAQSSPQLRGWLQTRQDLHAFADLVMQREKEGLTLSYIKNVIW